jgi:hypothetical protein
MGAMGVIGAFSMGAFFIEFGNMICKLSKLSGYHK